MASKTEQRKIEIIADAKKADASIKDMRAGVALLNNQLNKLPVGTQEFAEKSKELKEVKSRLKGVQTEATAVDGAFGGVIDQMIAMTPFSGQLQVMKDKMGGVQGGVKGLSGGFSNLGRAIALTGIGLLLTLLAGLYTYLTSTQEGMDKLNAVMRPLSALFQRIIGLVQELGGSAFKALGDAISNPKQAMIDLGKAIQENVMNRLKAFSVLGGAIVKILKGDFKEGFKELADGTIQVSTGITDATDKIGAAINNTTGFVEESLQMGMRLDELQKQIEKTEIELLKNRAALNDEYQKGKELAQDQSRSEEERLAAAKQAQDAQNELLAMEQGFLDLKIEKMELSQSLNDTSREDEKELAQLVADRTQFEADAAKKRSSAKSLENTINKELQAEELKRLNERKKAEEETQRQLLEARQRLADATVSLETQLQDLRIAVMEDGLDKELATLDLKHQRELQKLEQQKDEVLNNMAITEEEKINLMAMFKEEQDIREEEYLEAKKEKEDEAREATFEEEMGLLDEEEQLRAEQLENQFLQGLTTQQERDVAMLDLEKAYLDQRLALLMQNGQGQTAEAIRLKNQILAIEKEKNDLLNAEDLKREQLRKQIQQEGVAAAFDAMSLLVGFAQQEADEKTTSIDRQIEALKAQEGGEEANAARIAELEQEKERIRKEAAKKRQALEIAQTIADGIREVASIWAGSATLGPIAGPIVGALQTGFAIARTALNVRKIRSQQYAEGGFTSPVSVDGSGRLVDSTGFAVAGVAHEGEWYAPKWMVDTPQYANVIGWLESERTRKFADGGYSSPASTPASGPQSPVSVEAMQQNMMSLQNDFRMYAAKVDQWARELRVYNDVRETRDQLQTINRIDEQSSIR